MDHEPTQVGFFYWVGECTIHKKALAFSIP